MNTTTKRTAYELLLNKSTNPVEQHYSSSKVEVSNVQFEIVEFNEHNHYNFISFNIIL